MRFFKNTDSSADEITLAKKQLPGFNIVLLKKRLSGFETEEGRLSGLNYTPKSSNEIFITTTPKAGTTWTQQICHQLRAAKNGGDMEFTEISDVVPYLESAHDQGQDLNAPQYGDAEALPRLFKTHAWEVHCPKGAKTIVVLRDPMDVVVSYYKFLENWFFEAGTVRLNDFCREIWLTRGMPDDSKMSNASYFVHLVSWYKKKNEKDILILFFEDLKENLQEQIRRVAKFMSTEKHDFTTEECIALATKRSSFEFMKDHKDHFDEKLSKLARNEACGLPRMAGLGEGANAGSKVNNGRSGTGKKVLPEELQAEIQAKWMEVVEPVTGCATYEELRASFKSTRL